MWFSVYIVDIMSFGDTIWVDECTDSIREAYE